MTALVLKLPDPALMRAEAGDDSAKVKMVQHTAEHLSHIELSEERMKLVDKLTESVLCQIANHIDKNTFFPR